MSTPANVRIKIRRQDGPGKPSRWEEFDVPHVANMNIISCLQWIAAHPKTVAGVETTSPVWDAGCLEEVCGACTMVINGKVRQSCSALVDTLDQPITLEPMSKFPLVRDLFVDRQRLFNDLKRVKAWVPIDGTYDLGPGPTVSQDDQEIAYPLSRCIACGCCLEACPQYTSGNSFVGAAVISQARRFNEHPTGKALKPERLEVLMGEGGVSDCGKAQNCAAVCPKQIPLMESIAAVQSQATVYAIKRFFTKKTLPGGTDIPVCALKDQLVNDENELRIRHRNLPHWRMDGATYFITFRVLEGELTPAEREIVFAHIRAGEGKFYELIAVVIMPDHVHVILLPLSSFDLSRIMKGMKGVSSRLVQQSRESLGENLWQDESWDRIVRDDLELQEKLSYIVSNPVKAGLVDDGWDWPWLYIKILDP